jgi:hypothetical protein
VVTAFCGDLDETGLAAGRKRSIGRNDRPNALAAAMAGRVGQPSPSAAWFSLASHYPLVVIPFATSIALVTGSPDAEPGTTARFGRRPWPPRWL